MKATSFYSILFLVTLFISSVSAGNTYIVGVENLNYYPIYDGTSDFKGCAREILDEFAKAGDYKFVYKALPVKRLYKTFLDTGQLDLKFPDNQIWSSKLKEGKKISYSKDIIAYIDGVMVRPEDKSVKVDDFKKLGTIRGFTPWDYIDRIKSGKIKLDESDSFGSLLKKTLMGRTTGSYANVAVAKYYLGNTMKKPDNLIFNKNLPYTKSGYSLSSIKHPEIIKEFDKWLIKNKQIVDRAKEKYKAEAGVN